MPNTESANSKTNSADSSDRLLRVISDKYTLEELETKLPEWTTYKKLLLNLAPQGEIHHLGFSMDHDISIPLIAVSFGSKDPKAPVLGLFGGVHGLERIGSQVVLSLLSSFSQLILWDESLKAILKDVRIVFMPMINPIGILKKTRSNPRGVDLMRNAPIEALDQATFMVGGQKISSKLPWFRGTSTMENESQAVVDFCQKQILDSECVITVDFHSGFGLQDQLWFPYAKTKKAFPHLAEMFSLFTNLNRTFPNHFYKVEPQSLNYTTHGDLWDYSYDLYREKNPHGVFLPLCLEMGSWLWVRKNPLQIFSSLGPFNPMKPHRHKRILRRHQTLFDFLIRSIASHTSWAGQNLEQKSKYESQAMEHWYAKK